MTPEQDAMTPELSARLRERLTVRAQRLASMAAKPYCPTVVLALFAAHVTTTAILLLGKAFADQVMDKMITALRENNGICLCGNGLKAEGEPLCHACLKQCEDDDRECEEIEAMHQRTKGQPS